jgi:hypothetical protein
MFYKKKLRRNSTMLHLLYVFAFTIIAFIAVSNLIRSLYKISAESQNYYGSKNNSPEYLRRRMSRNSVPHPELLDDQGRPINEPLLVIKSVTLDDAREKLDKIFDASPSKRMETEE